VSLFCKNKQFWQPFGSHLEKFYLVLIGKKKKKIVKKYRGFVDSEFVKTCHEYVKQTRRLKALQVVLSAARA